MSYICNCIYADHKLELGVLFPGILLRPMMLLFATVIALFNLFQFIQNRLCKGVDGKDACCLGFWLNEKTGQCEKCPIGYFGKDCAEKCIYPFYGEDCQSICNCFKDGCHYSQGCFLSVETLSYQHLSSTKTYSTQFSTIFSTILMLNKTEFFQSETTDFLKPSTKTSDTTKNILLQNNDLLKNSALINLFGVFVLVCSIFVIAYIYFKCHRKNHNASGINQNEGQAQYKLLSLAALDTRNTAYSEQQASSNTDPMYLSPVFSSTESREIHGFQENEPRLDNNEVLEENTIDRQGSNHNDTYTEIDPTISLDDQAEQFYRELAQHV